MTAAYREATVEPMPTKINRKRPMRRLTLSDETWDRLGEYARRIGSNRSRVVDQLTREAPLPREKK